MVRDLFDGLTAFLLVAEHESFSKAARGLGVSAAAVSQTIRNLEEQLGLPLFQRTTRRVGLTEAGKVLRDRVLPASNDVRDALESLNGFRLRPMGHLKLTLPRIALPLVIEPVIPRFRHLFPDISVEIAVEDATVEIASRGFDAGIRLGESIETDMVAVRLTPDIIWSVLGSPAYFEAKGRPQVPADLIRHECILYRFPTSGAIHRWEFLRGGKSLTVQVSGKIITSDSLALISLARSGVGLTYSADLVAAQDVGLGRLEVALRPFLVKTPGLFLYFPARMQRQPKLRAFIDVAIATLKPHHDFS